MARGKSSVWRRMGSCIPCVGGQVDRFARPPAGKSSSQKKRGSGDESFDDESVLVWRRPGIVPAADEPESPNLRKLAKQESAASTRSSGLDSRAGLAGSSTHEFVSSEQEDQQGSKSSVESKRLLAATASARSQPGAANSGQLTRRSGMETPDWIHQADDLLEALTGWVNSFNASAQGQPQSEAVVPAAGAPKNDAAHKLHGTGDARDASNSVSTSEKSLAKTRSRSGSPHVPDNQHFLTSVESDLPQDGPAAKIAAQAHVAEGQRSEHRILPTTVRLTDQDFRDILRSGDIDTTEEWGQDQGSPAHHAQSQSATGNESTRSKGWQIQMREGGGHLHSESTVLTAGDIKSMSPKPKAPAVQHHTSTNISGATGSTSGAAENERIQSIRADFTFMGDRGWQHKIDDITHFAEQFKADAQARRNVILEGNERRGRSVLVNGWSATEIPLQRLPTHLRPM